jgi:hypothetical protein
VIVVNADKVLLTGNKQDQKVYYRHSQYPGGLKTESFRALQSRDATRVIRKAVRGMLPHNRLGDRVIKHLKAYSGPDHPHVAQVIGAERARNKREEAQKEAVAALRAKVAPVEAPGRARKPSREAELVTAAVPELMAAEGDDAQVESPDATEEPEAEPAAVAEEPTAEADDEAAGEKKAPARRTRRKVQKESDE